MSFWFIYKHDLFIFMSNLYPVSLFLEGVQNICINFFIICRLGTPMKTLQTL